jgi:hypothetical protein
MRHRLISFLSLSHIFLAFCQEPDGSLFANNTSPASFQELGPSVVAVEPSASIAKTAGPSGTLIQPKGGAIYKNHVGDVGNVEVIYRGVSDGTNDVGARTCTIDLHLVPVSRQSQTNSINLSNPAVIHVSWHFFSDAISVLTFDLLARLRHSSPTVWDPMTVVVANPFGQTLCPLPVHVAISVSPSFLQNIVATGLILIHDVVMPKNMQTWSFMRGNFTRCAVLQHFFLSTLDVAFGHERDDQKN